jgi:sugar lactone lactonase YvrE
MLHSRRFRTILTISATTLAAFLFFPTLTRAAYGDVTTFLGHMYAGDGGSRTAAVLDFPEDVEITSDGTFYVADTYDNVVRKVTPEGIISTFAGTGDYGFADGAAGSATFGLPQALTQDAAGNLYVADAMTGRIRKVSPSGVVITIVKAGLRSPQGLAIDGTTLYIADTTGNAIFRTTTSGGALTALTRSVRAPKKIIFTADKAGLYVANSGAYNIVRVDRATGEVSVVAGNGKYGYWEGGLTEAQFARPWGLALNGAKLYVTDSNGMVDYLRVIDLDAKQTSLVAVDYRMREMNSPSGVRFWKGSLYVANTGLGTIQRYSVTDPTDTEKYIGTWKFGDVNGAKADVLLGRPGSIAFTRDGSAMYVSQNNQIRKTTVATGFTTNVIGDITDGFGDGPANQLSPRVRFSTASSFVISPDEQSLYVADRWNNRIRKVDISVEPAVMSTLTGSGFTNSTPAMDNGYQEGGSCVTEALGQAGCAYFRGPQGIAISPDGATLYVADSGNNRIRSVRVSDGQTSLIAGSSAGYIDGVGAAAKFRSPSRLALSADGATLYVADTDNHRIRAITLATQRVTTLAGNRQGYEEGKGTDAAFSLPIGLAIGPNNLLYVSNVGSGRVMVISTKTGLVTLVAGSGDRGYRDGTWTKARFNSLAGIAVNPSGQTLYVADSWNDLIRSVDLIGGPKFSLPAPVYSRFLVAKLKQAKSVTQTAYIDIFGKNFRNGIQVTLGSIKLKPFVKSSTNINMLIPLGKMKPGYYDLRITNRDTQSVIKRAAFAITDSKGNIPKVYFRVK